MSLKLKKLSTRALVGRLRRVDLIFIEMATNIQNLTVNLQ